MEVFQDVKHAQLVAGVRPQLGQDRRVEVRPVGHHHRGRKPPGLEVLEEPPHVGLVVAGDQGEGHRQVVQRVGRQQQGHLAQVQLVDAERPAEVVQDPAAVIRQVEPPDLPVEAVVDEPIREIQKEVPPPRGDDPLDAHAVLEDAVEHGLTDLVVVQRPGFDARRGGAEGCAAVATGPVLAVGDVEEDDLLVGDGSDPAVVDGLAVAQLAAPGTGGFAGGAPHG